MSPSAPGPRRPATYEDLEKVPDTLIAELVDGELFASPRPTPLHGEAILALSIDLGRAFHRGGSGGPGGWLIQVEPEIHLGAHVVVPDLAGWRRERMPTLPPGEAHFTSRPDWLCEVLSPSTARLDRMRKLPLYAREGVRHVWLVDPRGRSLEVFRLEGEHWVLALTAAEDAVVRAEPFDAIELDLLPLWGEAREAPPSEG